jgi:hypothetical protein
MGLLVIIRIYLMSKKTLHIIFYAFAIISFIVMLYHIRGIFYPTNLTPAWRHGIFVLVNIICIYGLQKRPMWFIWFVGMLTLQQWYSHGSYAIHLWQEENKIHWVSILDVVLLPILVRMLFIDRKIKYPTNPAHS